SQQGLQSPLKGLQGGSDPVVRSGTNGLFYYSGIAFERNAPPNSQPNGVAFVATYIDNNNTESGDSIKYINTAIVAHGDSQQFLDKPWLAVDIPRAGAGNCVIDGQVFPAGNVYTAYSSFDLQDNSRIMFSRSTDCGSHWNTPIAITPGTFSDQGVSLAIDPGTGTIYAAWRRIVFGSQP